MKIKLLLDTGYYLLGNILTKSIALISIPIYTAYLTIAQYGKVSYFNSVVSIFSIIISGLIYTSLSRYYYEDDKKIKFDDFFCSFLVVQFAFSMLLMLIFILFNYKIIIKDSLFFSLVCAVSIFKVVNTTYFHIYQPRQLSSRIFIRQIFESVAIFLLSYFFLYGKTFDGELNVIYSQFLVFLILSLFIAVDLGRFFKINCEAYSFSNVNFTFKYIIKYSSFLWVSTILSTAILQVDKIYINNFLSDVELGIYSLAFNISFLTKVVSVSIFSAFTPRVMSFLSKNNMKQASDLLVLLRLIVFQAVLFLVLFSHEIVSLIPNGDSYHGSAFLISVISLAFWFDSLAVSATTHLSHLKETKKVLSPYLVSGVLYSLSLFFFEVSIFQVAYLFVLTCFISSMLLVVKVGFRKILQPLDLLMAFVLLITFSSMSEFTLLYKLVAYIFIGLFLISLVVKKKMYNLIS